ncbi:hypothetical protein JXD20_01260 [Candidatus Peregrinibacteria bacterium]|nr:hypothetical protein [Candidatus Peregrinibacteria bacterium]
MKKLLFPLTVFAILLTLTGCAPKEEKTPLPPVPMEPPVAETVIEESSALIILETPQAEENIISPLTIKGKARGNWFFEASFPVILANWDGVIIAETTAQAQGDWMTEDYVPFEAVLDFEKPDTSISNRGALILKKDNPSGLPENDDALEITIYFE